MEYTKRRSIKKFVILASLIFVVLFAINWIRTHSYLEISASPSSSQASFTYTLIDQNSGKTATLEATSAHIKRLVPKSNYLVLITQQETSYVTFSKTRGFLASTKVDGKLQPEKSRTFVGNEPNSCMYYDQVLYSYDCNEEYTTLKIHYPADQNQPTYTENATISNALIRGHALIAGNPLMLIKYTGGAVIDDSTHALHPFRNDLKLTDPMALKGLNNDETYSMLPYKEGFLVYTDSFEDIRYYSSPTSPSETIKIDKPSEDMKLPISVSAFGSNVATLFNQTTNHEEGVANTATNPNKSIKGKSELLIYDGNASRRLRFDIRYTSGGLCGDQKACLISNGKLDFYNISGQKPELLFSMPDVQTTQVLGNNLLIATNKNILALDTSALTGSVQYSYGGYEYCGLQISGSNYLACVKNKKGKSSALYIDPSQNNTDSIDKKILTLIEQPYVSGVSAYKSYIYISPELGEPEYNSNLNGYLPNPEIKQRAAKDIDNIINKLGIDRSIYQIINTQL